MRIGKPLTIDILQYPSCLYHDVLVSFESRSVAVKADNLSDVVFFIVLPHEKS